MQAFFNDPQLKASLLARLEGHFIADEIVQGHYWENGKGCFIGCAIHGDKEMEFPRQFGLSPYVARLGEYFFERFPAARAKALPIDIIASIPVGVDSSFVWPRFLHWQVTHPDYGLLRLPLEPAVARIVQEVDALYANWPEVDMRAADNVAMAARDAVLDAVMAATYAARAADNVAMAARDAVMAVLYAARAATYAARAATLPVVDAILDAQYTAFLGILRGMGPIETELATTPITEEAPCSAPIVTITP